MGSRDQFRMEPLRIRAWLRAGVISDPYLPLDGVLLYQHTRSDLGANDLTTPGASNLAQPKGEVMVGGRLPLAYVHCKDWYYRCSWAQWGPHVDGQDAWSKRFDVSQAYLVDFRGKRGKVDTSAATYKAYRMPVFYRSALWVEWYCVGDKTALERLLTCVTHLGKKTSQGWGRVARWEIQLHHDDWSIWGPDRQLMRGIPRYNWPRELGEPKIGLYGVRPSYWDRRNQIDLVLP
jgi:hypothetical protein